MTISEMTEFSISEIIESYECKDIKCFRHSPDFLSGADFSFTNFGITICGKVIARDDNLPIIPHKELKKEIDISAIQANYLNHGTIPRLFVASIKDADHPLEPLRCGHDFDIRISTTTLIPEPKVDKVLNRTREFLREKFIEIWNESKLENINKYFSWDCTYYLIDGSDRLTSREEIERYIGKFLFLYHGEVFMKLAYNEDPFCSGITILASILGKLYDIYLFISDGYIKEVIINVATGKYRDCTDDELKG